MMPDDPQYPTSRPQGNSDSPAVEPSVLDWFKSVTKDGQSFVRFLRSLRDAQQRSEIEWAVVEQARLEAEPESAAATSAAGEAEPAGPRLFPWRATLGLWLALLAQFLLEPPRANVELGVAFYIFAIGLVIWASIQEEWQLPALRTSLSRTANMSVRLLPLIISAVLAMIAFWKFEGNLFTPTNLALWLLALLFFYRAFWEQGRSVSAWQRLRDFMARDSWQVNITRRRILWAAVFVAFFGLMIFFRLNRIDDVPAEPFSDHAEKILDVYDVSQGKTLIFFERNTGREAFQMYWTLLISWVFGTGLSFLSLKIGTALLGLLTLPFIYLLGKEFGSVRLGILAMFLFGIAYWPNAISRLGLRFPLYPLFVAPVLLYLTRGLRTRSRNDFLLCGLYLGLGLHGYSPFRMVPLIVVIAFGLALLYEKSSDGRRQIIWWLLLIGIAALLVFMPLLRYLLERPDLFSYRFLTRLSDVEQPLPGPVWQVFLSNLWNGLRMFNFDDGDIWVHSVTHRPALDVVTGALFVLGIALLLVRFIRRRDWRDLFMLLLVPLLLMPSVLSLAYPDENPALNRAGGAAVPAILIAALALDGALTGLAGPVGRRGTLRPWLAWSLTGALLAGAAYQNYDLVFRQFDAQYRAGAWNTSEMGKVISDFRDKYGQTDTFWIVPYPFWVDTRLPGVWAGIPNRDFAMFPENLSSTLTAPYPKMFIFNREDAETGKILRELYPDGRLSRYTSAVEPNKDFMLYFVEK